LESFLIFRTILFEKEVLDNGISLREMGTKFFLKIEELALCLIYQDKK